MNERLIEQIISSTPIPEYQKELVNKKKGFTIQEAVELGRSYEASLAHMHTLHTMNGQTSQLGVSTVKQSHGSSKCKNCGGDHRIKKDNCPARNDNCRLCNKRGHWAKFCLTTKYKRNRSRSRSQNKHSSYRMRSTSPRNRHQQQRTQHRHRNVHTVDNSTMNQQCDVSNLSNQFDTFTFNSIHVSSLCLKENERDEAFATLNIKLTSRLGTHKLELKVDTGAQANTLPLRTYRRMFPNSLNGDGNPKHDALNQTSNILTAYNGTQIKCFGTVDIDCNYSSIWTNTKFYVVDVPGPAVLGLPSCETLNVVTLHCSISRDPPANNPPKLNNINDLINEYPNQFDHIGEFPTVHKLVTDPNVPPHINPPRKTPIALKDQITEEINKIEEQGIIKRIEQPTEWVNSLTYVTKRDGSIRVCLDPGHLNKALVRPQHRTPTLAELTHKFANAKVFSKLDAKSGYWSIKHDPESQKLTTFQTPLGRYCFQRLPFGLSVSQDLFQLEMDRILENSPNVCNIADDIVIYGENEAEHDQCLRSFMDTAKQNGLVLNSSKCEIKKDQISFFGNIYTSQGIKPDPQKVNDINALPEPQDKTELQQFLGMLTYLSSFIKDFSSKSSVLRDLLKKDVDFIWEAHHQNAFDSLKSEISESSLLNYYKPDQPVYLECDASLRGLGAALLQYDDNDQLQPIAYASKSLTPTEQRYACIERELLAIVFGIQRFHTYLYGRSFHVVTDHKPLIEIVNKPLTSAPPLLQRMLIKLQGYNFTIEHRPGKDNPLAGGLSRLPNPNNKTTIDLDLRVDFVSFST